MSRDSEPRAAAAEPGKGRRAARICLHASFLLAFLAVGGALLVWPQWIALEGARSALEVQREQEQHLTERLDALRGASQRLRDWQREGRRVFLIEELGRYPGLVTEAAQRESVAVEQVHLTGRCPARWRGLSIEGAAVRPGEAEVVGDIEPRAIRVVLKGSFAGVYRTLVTLSSQQQIFIPDSWELAREQPNSGTVRAVVWATVFVVREAEQSVTQGAVPPAGGEEVGG